MDWAFREFEDVTLFTAGDTVEQAPVWLGDQPDGAAGRWARPGGDDAAGNGGAMRRSRCVYDCPIRAPVARGDTARASWRCPGQGVPDMDVPLLAGADVPKLEPARPGDGGAVAYVTGS